MQPGALFISNAGSPYRGLPQDDTSFTKKFLGFASPPHDGFADKYSIITKENLQAVYTAPLPLFSYYYYTIIHDAKLLVKSFLNFFANCGFHASYSLFFYCPRIPKTTKCETQQTATIATMSANVQTEPKITTIFSRHFSLPYPRIRRP